MNNILHFNAEMVKLGLMDAPTFIELPSEYMGGFLTVTQLLNLALTSDVNKNHNQSLPRWWWGRFNSHDMTQCYIDVVEIVQYISNGDNIKSCHLPLEVCVRFEHAPEPTRQLIAMLLHPNGLEYGKQPLPDSIHGFATAYHMFRLMKTDGDKVNVRDTPLLYTDCLEMMARVLEQKNADFENFLKILFMVNEYSKEHDVSEVTQWLVNGRLELPRSYNVKPKVFFPIGLMAKYFNPHSTPSRTPECDIFL